MADIRKGKISTFTSDIDENSNPKSASVISSTSSSLISRPLVIPWYLRGKSGNLSVGTEVVYALFEDMSGIILSRADGEWGGYIHGDVVINDISMQSHVHTVDGITSSAPKNGG